MSRKATKPKSKAKTPAKPKPVTAYIVVREIPSESTTYTEPDRVFLDKKAAQKYADELNLQLRKLVNPFSNNEPRHNTKGGEKAFIALVKKLKLPVPPKDKDYGYIDWEAWWDRHYFDMTDAQRDAIWDSQVNYNWYLVTKTTVEG
jgi:hypothetical protein